MQKKQTTPQIGSPSQPSDPLRKLRSLLVLLFQLCMVFCLILITEVLLVTLANGALPNRISLPPIESFGLYQILWQSSPVEMLHYLMTEEAWLIIEYRHIPSYIQIWGLFYYPLTLLVHGIVTLLTVLYIRSKRHTHRSLVFSALLLLLVSSLYLQLASCCTGGPGWIIEVVFRAKALDPLNQFIDWWSLYAWLEPLFVYIQFMCALLGIFQLGWLWKRKTNERSDS